MINKDFFLLWTTSDWYKNVLKEAKSIIDDALKRHKCYVAFSGGKDSTCVLHLVLQYDPNILVLHWDYGRYYIPAEVERQIICNAKAMGAKNVRVETSSEYEKLGRNAINVLGREYLGKLVGDLHKQGYTGVFVGLRKEESIKRKLRIKNQINITCMKEFYPVSSWKWQDVWAYIFSNNVPYLEHYDKYARVVGWDKARFTTFFDPEFDKFGCSNIDGVLNWKFKNINVKGRNQSKKSDVPASSEETPHD